MRIEKTIDYSQIESELTQALQNFKEGKDFKKPVLKEGIYLNMPEKVYHLLDYYSNSTNKEVIIDPKGEELWHNNQWLNRDFKAKAKKECYDFGSAFHCMVLEPVLFQEKYIVKKSKSEFDDKLVLDTVPDLKKFLKGLGESTSGNKPELIERCLEFMDTETHVIWDEYERQFNESAEQKKQIIITSGQKEQLDGMRESLDYQENITSLLDQSHKEVVIIWIDHDTNIKCKARLDALHFSGVLDPKTFSLKGNTISEAIAKTMRYDRYTNQHYVYDEALKSISAKIKSGKAQVFGDMEASFLEKFIEQKCYGFSFIYVRTEAPYQVRAIKMKQAEVEGAESNNYYQNSRQEFDNGLMIYRNLLLKYKRGDQCREVQQEFIECTDEMVGFQVPRLSMLDVENNNDFY